MLMEKIVDSKNYGQPTDSSKKMKSFLDSPVDGGLTLFVMVKCGNDKSVASALILDINVTSNNVQLSVILNILEET